MIFLTMAINLCTTFSMVNETSYRWNEHDIQTVFSSTTTCAVKYSSCLKKFVKTNEKDYQAICQ